MNGTHDSTLPKKKSTVINGDMAAIIARDGAMNACEKERSSLVSIQNADEPRLLATASCPGAARA
jgi:hypothetical protein